MSGLETRIRRAYAGVLERIHQAAGKAGRNPETVRLVVVTKGHAVETVRATIEAGVRILGENYPEEGAAKAEVLKEYDPIEWHMIGHVQSRKARLVSGRFAWVHSLDSIKLAQKLDQGASEFGRILPVLIECNVSAEETKYGFPAWDEKNWGALAARLEPILQLQHIRVEGLMTMAPFFTDSEKARPFFNRLYRLKDFLESRYPQSEWTQLSMGMSADFEAAVQEGATMVRIGEAILGPRAK